MARFCLAGGMSTSDVLNTAQLYTSSSQTTFAAASPMNVARWLHTATLLNDGTVLVAGGSSLSNETTLNTAEISDPVAGTFTLLPEHPQYCQSWPHGNAVKQRPSADCGEATIQTRESSRIQNSTIRPRRVFIDLGNTNTPRFHHTATLLQNGRVLVTGGETDPTPSGAYNTAEIFNPSTATFTPVSATKISAR